MSGYISNFIVSGLTGGICSGKSTIAKTFIAYDVPVIDADQIARDVVVHNSTGLNSIIEVFGKQYLFEDGSLNRKKLGDLIFNDKKSLDKINSIMDPLIKTESEKRFDILKNQGHKLIIYDAALLIERGHIAMFRPLIVAHCDQEQQIKRLMKRGTGHGALTRDEAMARIAAQMPVSEKIKMADYLVNTSGTVEQSIAQTEEIIKKLKCMTS